MTIGLWKKHIHDTLKFWFITYPKYSKEEKCSYRIYIRKIKETRKKLHKAARNFKPWDYGFLLDFVVPVVDEWVEYYERGYNVAALELKEGPSRLEIAKHLKELLDRYSSDDSVAFTNDGILLKEFFDYLGQFICRMWD